MCEGFLYFKQPMCRAGLAFLGCITFYSTSVYYVVEDAQVSLERKKDVYLLGRIEIFENYQGQQKK